MASTVVPYEEIERLIQLILYRFTFQTNIKLNREDLSYQFITPRQGMKIGFEIKNSTGIAGRHFCARVYIDFYDFAPNIGDFRREEFQDSGLGLGNEAMVSIAMLPRADFPVMSKAVEIDAVMELTIGIEDAILTNDNTVGFDPQGLVVPFGGYANVRVALTDEVSGNEGVTANTVPGTALAGVDYSTLSENFTWEQGDPKVKLFQVPLLANRKFFNWHPDFNTSNILTYRNHLQILDSNRHLYSPPGDTVVPYNEQQFLLTSQYLENKTQYFEIEVTDFASMLAISLNQNFYANLPYYLNSPEFFANQALAEISIYGHGEAQDLIAFQVVLTDYAGEIYHNFYTETNLTRADLPVRLKLLLDPNNGAKVGYNQYWGDHITESFVNNVNNAAWFDFRIPEAGDEEMFTGEKFVAKDISRYNLAIYASKYEGDGESVDPQVNLDLRFITTTAGAQFRPVGYDIYQGISYPTTARSFGVNLSNPSDDVTIQSNPGTVNLVSLNAYSYAKLVTNDNYSGFTPEALAFIDNNDHWGHKPILQWTSNAVECGYTIDLTKRYKAWRYSGAVTIRPSELDYVIDYQDIQRGTVLPYMDRMALPIDAQPGASFMYHSKNFSICLGNPMTDGEVAPNVPSPLFNGVYTFNNDGTYDYRVLFRYYQTSTGKRVLMSVPPNNNDAVNAVPTLQLHLLTPPGNYEVDAESSDGIYIDFLVSFPNPDLVESAMQLPEGADPAERAGILLYYTYDGEDPTEESEWVLLFADSPIGFVGTVNLPGGPGSETRTLKAFAKAVGWNSSAIVSGEYYFSNSLAPPIRRQVELNGEILHPFSDENPANIDFFSRGENDHRYKDVVITLENDEPESVFYHSVAKRPFVLYEGPFSITDNLVPSGQYLDNAGSYIVTMSFKSQLPEAAYDNFETNPIYFQYHKLQIRLEPDSSSNWRITPVLNEDGEEVEERISFISDSSGGSHAEVELKRNPEARSFADDIRYMEVKMGALLGRETDIALVLSNFHFYRNGILDYVGGGDEGEPIDIGLPWGDHSVVRILTNLRTGGFRLAVDGSSWYDNMEDPNTLSEVERLAIRLFPNMFWSSYGTTFTIRTRATSFDYPIPNGAVAMEIE